MKANRKKEISNYKYPNFWVLILNVISLPFSMQLIAYDSLNFEFI
jgi:hypothetical protein